MILRAVTVGSPPEWSDVPEEYQSSLAALDQLENAALWKIAQAQKEPAEMLRYEELLERHEESSLTEIEQIELSSLRKESERFMLRKAHAASILK